MTTAMLYQNHDWVGAFIATVVIPMACCGSAMAFFWLGAKQARD
jgi:hypothetical protein